MSRRRTVAVVAILAWAVGLTACGTGGQESDDRAGSCDTSRGTLVIGMIVPLSGGLSALGLGMRNSADLAVRQANQQCTVPGHRLEFRAEDDQGAPRIADQAARELAGDPSVVGVIGTYNSSTAQAVQPILHEAGIVQISPGNTGPSLTRGDDPTGAPVRPYDTYFRTATTDLEQGPFGADYLVQVAGKKRVAVIDDGKTYGAGIARQFVQRAEELGATILAPQKVGERDTDFSGAISRIRTLGPDAVYYGGEYPVAGPLSKQLAEAGLDVPLMGGDGILNDEYVQRGGREGDLGTSVGVPVEQLPSAEPFITAYEAAGYAEGYDSYGALAYDSTNILIAALTRTAAAGDWSPDRRRDVVAAVQASDTQGVTGQIRFDEFGDTTNKVLTLYRVENGRFVPVRTGVFRPN